MTPFEVIKVLVSARFKRIKASFKLWWLDAVQQAELIQLEASFPHHDEPDAFETACDILSEIDRIETRAAILRTEVLIREARRLGVEIPPREHGEYYACHSEDELWPETWYLTPKGFLTVRNALSDAKKRQREGAMFWFGLFGSAFGMAMAVWKSLP